MEGRNAQLGSETVKVVNAQGLSEDIGKLVRRRDVSKVKETLLNSVTDEMAINFNVFGPFMENWVAGNMHSGLIVTVKRDGG
jgi:hypothetical protein